MAYLYVWQRDISQELGMNMTKVQLWITLLIFLALAGFSLGLTAQQVMGIVRVNSSTIDMDYKAIGMYGDCLVLFDYQVNGRVITANRITVNTSGIATPPVQIYSLDIPADYGNVTQWPLQFDFRDGKLRSAFSAGNHLYICFTDSLGTEVHQLNGGEISSCSRIETALILDESTAYISYENYPDLPDQTGVARIDLATDTIQPLITQPGWTIYSFQPVSTDYVVVKANDWGESPEYLLHGSTIVHTYPDGIFDNGYDLHTYAINDLHSFMKVGDGLQRYGYYSTIGHVQDGDLVFTPLSIPYPGPEVGYSLGYTVSDADSTFSGILYYESFSGGLLEVGFHNWLISNGSTDLNPVFPDLSSVTDAEAYLGLDQTYRVASSGSYYANRTMRLIDTAEQSIRSFEFAVAPGYYSYLNSSRYIYQANYDRVYTYHVELVTSAEDELAPALTGLKAYPNPSYGDCRIELSTAKAVFATLDIYNLRGQKVKTLHEGSLPAGNQTFAWDGKDDQGRIQPQGIYLIKADTAGQTRTGKLIRIK